MAHYSTEIACSTRGFADVSDITAELRSAVERSGIRTGLVCVALAGSTGGVTTIEYEPGAVADLKEALERLVPVKGRYRHDATWGDGNGFAHVRSALLGTSRVFPVIDGELALGTWQQAVLVDFDNRPRQRRLTVLVIGDRD
jgi:secondary thiamine-phosphate synthase enzyme